MENSKEKPSRLVSEEQNCTGFAVQKENPLAEASKIKWSSRREFIISLLGYSLGLTDIWRVPYITYRNGGGAFLIPYIFFMLVCGIPLYFLEIMVSQFSGKGSWKVWDICPLFRGFGIAYVVINWVVAAYTMLHKPWIIEYIIASFSSVLPWSTCNNEWNTPGCVSIAADKSTVNVTNYTVGHDISNMTTTVSSILVNGTRYIRQSSVEEFWNYQVLDISSGIDDIGELNLKYILYLLVCHLVIWISLVKSVQSIGKMMYVTAIAPVILTFVIWIRALTLTGSTKGMLYFITPDFSRLANAQVWIEAAFMAFYTLGPAWGGLAMYGSHNKFKDNCYRDAIISTVLTVTYGLFNGLVIFSVVGVLSYESNVPIDQVITSGGFSLGFVAYPKAITYFPLPQVWAVLFFIILLLPGIDCQTTLMEPVLCVIEENFPKTIGKRRIPLLTGITILTFIVGIPLTSQAGVFMFQLIDWYTATWSILLIAVTESIVFSWIYGGDRLSRDVGMMLGRTLPVFVRVSCAFVTPIVLTLLVIVSMFKYKPPRYGTYIYPSYAVIIGWCFAMASIIPIVGWIFFAIQREKGSMLQRFKKLLKPSKSWEPSEHFYKDFFRKSELSHKRSVKKLALFNLTGKGGISVKLDGIGEEQELPNLKC